MSNIYQKTQIKSRPKCGEIWMCKLSENDGSIQSGYRPVFILSNDKNNEYSTTLNIIPITSKTNKRKLPVHVELLNHKNYGLKTPSTMLVEQVTTIAADSLDKYIGKVIDPIILNDIQRAIRVQFPVLQML